MIAQILLDIIDNGLKFLKEHHAQALQDRVYKLRETFRHEQSKGSSRDDNLLDQCELELLDIGRSYLDAIKSAAPSDK